MLKKGISLRVIIIVMASFLVILPVVVFGIIELKIAGGRASIDARNMIRNDILTTQRNIGTIFEGAQTKVKSDLALADYILNSSGDIYLDNEHSVKFNAENQISKELSELEIPSMMAGSQSIAHNYTIVDKVYNQVGGTSTIFQVIPEGLLRISTNVLKEDSFRAVGTYIPNNSPVYKTVMNGDTFYGRAYVVNAWYITAYQPIFDSKDTIIGALYVGVKESPFKKKIFTNLMQKKLGNNGYYEIVDKLGYYEMPHDIKLYGKNVFDIKDTDGNNFMRSLVDSAVKLESGELGDLSYNWRESNEEVARERTSSFVYFKPWNWAIIANIYNDDLVRERVGEDLLRIGIIIAVFSIIGIILAIFIARAISDPLVHTQHSVERISSGNFTKSINIRTGVKELKLLGNSVDSELIPKISNIINEIQNSVEISGNISKIMQNYSKDAGDISSRLHKDIVNVDAEMGSLNNQISEVSSAVSEILATIENLVMHIDGQSSAVSQTSAAIEEMTASINSIARIASEKSDSTNSLKDTVETGRKKVSVSNEQIKNISTDVDNMMDIIGVINSIAAQTNLLAMNAAIEAAHAGEYGLGFAVVADEIRKLAESTSSNAKIISNSLKEAVGKMGMVLNSGEESEKAFKAVAQEVTQFINALIEITQSTNEVSEGNREILSAIDSLMQISQEISNGSSEIKLSSEDINNAVNTIKQASETVVEKVSNVKTGLGDITSAQEDIIKTVDWNDTNLGEVEKNISFFDLMDSVETNKLNLYITDILVHHQGWMADASRAIGGSLKLDVKKVSNYESCKLGIWLYGEGRDTFGGNKHFQSIVENHKEFHLAIVNLANNLENSNMSDVFINYNQIRNNFQSIVTDFRTLLNV